MPKNPSQPSSYQAPYPLAMIICEGIWYDPSSTKRTLLGCLSGLSFPEFPASHPLIAVHVAMTDGRGQIPVTLRLVHADEENEPIVASEELIVDFQDPTMEIEIDFEIRWCTFERPGEYRFQLFCGNDFLLERRLDVNQIPEGPS
jgi:hypothetical protein